MTTRQTNQLQITLIQESNLDAIEWISRYAKRFREIVSAKPLIFKKIKIEEIKHLLYNTN